MTVPEGKVGLGWATLDGKAYGALLLLGHSLEGVWKRESPYVFVLEVLRAISQNKSLRFG